jgi:hypothetical protein
MMEPGGGEQDNAWRASAVLPLIAVAGVVGLTIGLAVGGPLGSKGDGQTSMAVVNQAPRTTTATAPTPPVSIQLHTKKLVWVCLLDQSGRPVINGLNLIADQTIGPYGGEHFEVSFGNGSVDLTVNGRIMDVPRIAAPFGYRITPEGATRLPPSEQPSCT